MNVDRYDLAVVGGGIAGLAAAWQATRHNRDARVLVAEASDRFGGKLHTAPFMDRPLDRGADAFLVRTPDAVQLIDELELSDEVVHPAQRSALLYLDGALRRLPDGLVLGIPTDLDAVEASGILSADGLAHLRADLERGQHIPVNGHTSAGGETSVNGRASVNGHASPGDQAASQDISVGQLVRSRLGDEVFDRLVAPLLAGINAGDPDQLSMAAGAPQLETARRHPSLIEGVTEQRAAADTDAPVFASLRGGTERLVQTLTAELRRAHVTLAAGRAVTGLAPGFDARYRLVFADADIEATADRVVLATPTAATATVLDDLAGRLEPNDPVGAEAARQAAVALGEVLYASVAVVALAYPRDAVAHPLDASGMLVPDTQGLLCTACSFGSAKWPHWSDPAVVVLRASVGRFHDARFLAMSDDGLVRHLHNELAPILGISATPIDRLVTRWHRALPQYRPGHLERIAAVEDLLHRGVPALALAGAGVRGIGIPACIRSGRTATDQLMGRALDPA